MVSIIKDKIKVLKRRRYARKHGLCLNCGNKLILLDSPLVGFWWECPYRCP